MPRAPLGSSAAGSPSNTGQRLAPLDRLAPLPLDHLATLPLDRLAPLPLDRLAPLRWGGVG